MPGEHRSGRAENADSPPCEDCTASVHNGGSPVGGEKRWRLSRGGIDGSFPGRHTGAKGNRPIMNDPWPRWMEMWLLAFGIYAALKLLTWGTRGR